MSDIVKELTILHKEDIDDECRRKKLFQQLLNDNPAVKKVLTAIDGQDIYRDGWNGQEQGEIIFGTNVYFKEILESLGLPEGMSDRYKDEIYEALTEDGGPLEHRSIRLEDGDDELKVSQLECIIGISYGYGIGQKDVFISSYHSGAWDSRSVQSIDDYQEVDDDYAFSFMVNEHYKSSGQWGESIYVQHPDSGNCVYNEELTRLAIDIMDKNNARKIVCEDDFVVVCRFLDGLNPWYPQENTEGFRRIYELLGRPKGTMDINNLRDVINTFEVPCQVEDMLADPDVFKMIKKWGLIKVLREFEGYNDLKGTFEAMRDKGIKVAFVESVDGYSEDFIIFNRNLRKAIRQLEVK